MLKFLAKGVLDLEAALGDRPRNQGQMFPWADSEAM